MLLSVFVFALICQISNAEDPLVQLPNGWIRGRKAVTLKSKSYFAFEKIPYAKPPVGNLRFQAPVPPDNWEGVLDTLLLDTSCYQATKDDGYESEDCLFINVFTPKLNGSLPVMLFIHGGGFVRGSSITSRADRLLENDIVFVTINYRVGPFGFISTQDDVIPGNNGLKDQHLAIKWAHDNIHLFGGNPDQITIFGQSAGSASCAYQLLNQANKGLFRGAILQSGSFLSPWAFQRRAREIAFATAGFINDTFDNSNDSVALRDFLLTVDAEVLDTASDLYFASFNSVIYEDSPKDVQILQGFYWAPVVEAENPDAFLTEKMYGLLQAGKILSVPVMMGITSEEGILFTDSTTLKYDMASYDTNLNWLVPNDMQVTDETKRTEIGSLIREMYTQGEELADHLGDGVRYFTDTSFSRPVIKHAEIYTKLAPTYFYQFSYHGELGGNHIHYPGADNVGHGEDTKYLFCTGTRCNITTYPESDQLTVERMVYMWTNFAKYQNPTPEPSPLLQNLTWPQFFSENGNYLYVNINETLEIKNHPKGNTYNQWVQLYGNLGYNDFDTY